MDNIVVNYNYSVFNSTVSRFLKLTQIRWSNKFAFFFGHLQNFFKFLLNSLQTRFKSASKLFFLSDLFKKICFRLFQKSFHTFHFVSNSFEKRIKLLRNEVKLIGNSILLPLRTPEIYAKTIGIILNCSPVWTTSNVKMSKEKCQNYNNWNVNII